MNGASIIVRSVGLMAGALALTHPAFAEGPAPGPPTTPDSYIAEGLIVPAFGGAGSLARRMEWLEALDVQCDGRPLPCYVTGAVDAPMGLVEFAGVVSSEGPNAMADIVLTLADGRELDIRLLVPRDQVADLLRERRFRP